MTQELIYIGGMVAGIIIGLLLSYGNNRRNIRTNESLGEKQGGDSTIEVDRGSLIIESLQRPRICRPIYTTATDFKIEEGFIRGGQVVNSGENYGRGNRLVYKNENPRGKTKNGRRTNKNSKSPRTTKK